MLTKSQKSLLKSIDAASKAVLSYDSIAGRVAIISGDVSKPVRLATYLALKPHLVKVPSGYSTITHYKAKGE